MPRFTRFQIGSLAALSLVVLAAILQVTGVGDPPAAERAPAPAKAPNQVPGVPGKAGVLDEARRLIRAAQSQRKMELFDRAEGLLRGALERHPHKDRVLAALGHLQLQKTSYTSGLMGGQKVPASARELFQRALKQNPRSVRALEGLGIYHELRRDLREAVKADDRALAVAPQSLRIWQHKGKCLVKLKRYTEAEQTLLTTIDRARAAGNLRILVYTQAMLGRVYMKQGKYAQAEKMLRASVDTAESNRVTACPYAALGELYVVTGQKDRLLEVYKRAADMEVQKPRMQYDAAYFCLEKGEYANALKYINRAMAIEARPRYQKLRDEIRSEMKPRPPEEDLRAAMESFNRHRFSRARRHIDRALSTTDRAAFKVVRGYLWLLEKKYKKAEGMLRAARKTAPGDAGALVGLGHLRVIAKDYAGARARFEPAVKAGARTFSGARGGAAVLGRYDYLTYRMACLGMGWLSSNQNRHEVAIRFFDRILALDAEDIFALLGKGNSQNALNRLDSAERQLKKALALSPGNKYALAELALVSYNRGDDQEAERLFKAALKRDRTWRYTCPYEGLGLIYLRAGKIDKAKASFKQAIKINPNIEYKKFNGLARIFISEGKLHKARELLRRSIKNYPYDNEARGLLARIGQPGAGPPAAP